MHNIFLINNLFIIYYLCSVNKHLDFNGWKKPFFLYDDTYSVPIYN